MKLKDVQIEVGGLKQIEIDLAALVGKKVVHVVGYLSEEFGDVTFMLTKIVFEGGNHLYCEGEHDMPYVTDSSPKLLPSAEVLEALHEEQNAED